MEEQAHSAGRTSRFLTFCSPLLPCSPHCGQGGGIGRQPGMCGECKCPLHRRRHLLQPLICDRVFSPPPSFVYLPLTLALNHPLGMQVTLSRALWVTTASSPLRLASTAQVSVVYAMPQVYLMPTVQPAPSVHPEGPSSIHSFHPGPLFPRVHTIAHATLWLDSFVICA